MTDATEKSEQPKATVENGEDKSGLFSPVSVAGWFAIGGVLIIAISFVWEWGYWSFFGVSLAEIPMSVENLASAIFAWMPFFLLAAMTMSVFFMQLVPSFREYTEVFLQMKSMPNEDQRLWVRIILAITPAVLIIMIAVIPIMGIYFLYPELSALLPYGLFLAILGFYSLFRFFSVHFIVWVMFSAAVLIWAIFGMARFVASEDIIYGPRAHIDIRLETNDEIMKRMIILRNSHDFIYAYNPTSQKLLIVPWDMVRRITYNAEIDTPIRMPSIFRLRKKEDK